MSEMIGHERADLTCSFLRTSFKKILPRIALKKTMEYVSDAGGDEISLLA